MIIHINDVAIYSPCDLAAPGTRLLTIRNQLIYAHGSDQQKPVSHLIYLRKSAFGQPGVALTATLLLSQIAPGIPNMNRILRKTCFKFRSPQNGDA